MKKQPIYTWKNSLKERVYHVTAEEAHEAFEDIRQRKGKLTPEGVVDEARPEESVLHKDFEWRDEIAAEKYRQSQARVMIGAIRIIREDSPTPVKAYINIQTVEKPPIRFSDAAKPLNSSADASSRSYMPLEEILQKPKLYAQMMKNAQRDAETYLQKYRVLEELQPIMSAIEKTFKEV